MEQTPIITSIHKKFLELVIKEPYLLKKYYWTGGTVLSGYAKAKFDWHIEPIQLGENFAKVSIFSDFPKMLVPFESRMMEDFFLKLAKGLKKDIFY